MNGFYGLTYYNYPPLPPTSVQPPLPPKSIHPPKPMQLPAESHLQSYQPHLGVGTQPMYALDTHSVLSTLPSQPVQLPPEESPIHLQLFQPHFGGAGQPKYPYINHGKTNENRMAGNSKRNQGNVKKRQRRKPFNPLAEMNRLQNRMIKVQQTYLQQQWLGASSSIACSSLAHPQMAHPYVAPSAPEEEHVETVHQTVTEEERKIDRTKWWWPFH